MNRPLFLRILAAAALGALLVAGRPAAAATLKTDVVVSGDIVTLGDLFEGAGALAATPVFRAPDAGVPGVLSADQALAAAAAAGLEASAPLMNVVTVSRVATVIDDTAITNLVRAAAADRLTTSAEALDIAFDAPVEAIQADASAAKPVTLASLALQPASGRFTVRFLVDVGAETRPMEFTGRAMEMVEVPVMSRPLDRRQVLGMGDLEMQRFEKRRLPASVVRDADAMVGMAARRPLRVGETISRADLEQPRVVLRNEIVTLVYERPGLALTARGRALGDAAAGDLVSVLNEQSRRTIQGIAAPGGVVRIGPGMPAGQTAALTQ
jgi:flagella basal body P-ring formation protein FlgA